MSGRPHQIINMLYWRMSPHQDLFCDVPDPGVQGRYLH